MGGIRTRNLFEESMLANMVRWGLDVWIPPNDEQSIVAATSLADATADADFTLATPITNMGFRLMWPCKLFIVLRNRATAATGAPGITQVNPTFAGNDAFEVKVTGKLRGRVVTETLTVNVSTITSPAGQQRSHILTSNFYDEITSIRHQNKSGTWGGTTALSVSVGLGNCEHGAASNNRLPLRFPFKVADGALLKRLLFPFDGTSAAIGAGLTNANIDNSASSFNVPGRAARFENAFTATVTVATDLFTKTAHGLTAGQTVMIGDRGDGLPGGVTANTIYYVISTGLTADVFSISATPEGAAVNLATTATTPGFADGELVFVRRPVREWRQARLVFDDGIHIEGV